MNKKGQIFGMSFTTIFSILLIIAFIIIAFIAIRYFLGIGECSEVGLFYRDLQEEVDDIYFGGQVVDKGFEIKLPSGIGKVCFANLSEKITNQEDYSAMDAGNKNHNVFLVLFQKACNLGSNKINHINMTEITKNSNPWCVDVSRELRLKKDFYDKYVRIE